MDAAALSVFVPGTDWLEPSNAVILDALHTSTDASLPSSAEQALAVSRMAGSVAISADDADLFDADPVRGPPSKAHVVQCKACRRPVLITRFTKHLALCGGVRGKERRREMRAKARALDLGLVEIHLPPLPEGAAGVGRAAGKGGGDGRKRGGGAAGGGRAREGDDAGGGGALYDEEDCPYYDGQAGRPTSELVPLIGKKRVRGTSTARRLRAPLPASELWGVEASPRVPAAAPPAPANRRKQTVNERKAAAASAASALAEAAAQKESEKKNGPSPLRRFLGRRARTLPWEQIAQLAMNPHVPRAPTSRFVSQSSGDGVVVGVGARAGGKGGKPDSAAQQQQQTQQQQAAVVAAASVADHQNQARMKPTLVNAMLWLKKQENAPAMLCQMEDNQPNPLPRTVPMYHGQTYFAPPGMFETDMRVPESIKLPASHSGTGSLGTAVRSQFPNVQPGSAQAAAVAAVAASQAHVPSNGAAAANAFAQQRANTGPQASPGTGSEQQPNRTNVQRIVQAQAHAQAQAQAQANVHSQAQAQAQTQVQAHTQGQPHPQVLDQFRATQAQQNAASHRTQAQMQAQTQAQVQAQAQAQGQAQAQAQRAAVQAQAQARAHAQAQAQAQAQVQAQAHVQTQANLQAQSYTQSRQVRGQPQSPAVPATPTRRSRQPKDSPKVTGASQNAATTSHGVPSGSSGLMLNSSVSSGAIGQKRRVASNSGTPGTPTGSKGTNVGSQGPGTPGANPGVSGAYPPTLSGSGGGMHHQGGGSAKRGKNKSSGGGNSSSSAVAAASAAAQAATQHAVQSAANMPGGGGTMSAGGGANSQGNNSATNNHSSNTSSGRSTGHVASGRGPNAGAAAATAAAAAAAAVAGPGGSSTANAQAALLANAGAGVRNSSVSGGGNGGAQFQPPIMAAAQAVMADALRNGSAPGAQPANIQNLMAQQIRNGGASAEAQKLLARHMATQAAAAGNSHPTPQDSALQQQQRMHPMNQDYAQMLLQQQSQLQQQPPQQRNPGVPVTGIGLAGTGIAGLGANSGGTVGSGPSAHVTGVAANANMMSSSNVPFPPGFPANMNQSQRDMWATMSRTMDANKASQLVRQYTRQQHIQQQQIQQQQQQQQQLQQQQRQPQQQGIRGPGGSAAASIDSNELLRRMALQQQQQKSAAGGGTAASRQMIALRGMQQNMNAAGISPQMQQRMQAVQMQRAQAAQAHAQAQAMNSLNASARLGANSTVPAGSGNTGTAQVGLGNAALGLPPAGLSLSQGGPGAVPYRSGPVTSQEEILQQLLRARGPGGLSGSVGRGGTAGDGSGGSTRRAAADGISTSPTGMALLQQQHQNVASPLSTLATPPARQPVPSAGLPATGVADAGLSGTLDELDKALALPSTAGKAAPSSGTYANVANFGEDDLRDL